MDEGERYDKGMNVRRAVLGDAHVDRTLAKRDAFNEEFQQLITRYAWGEIWTRPGLPRHTRSLITVAMMVALNRADEFRLHVRAAFNKKPWTQAAHGVEDAHGTQTWIAEFLVRNEVAVARCAPVRASRGLRRRPMGGARKCAGGEYPYPDVSK
jgi:alkylhydroperoxidase/carboxymuconolactone decarboxylase family protein YurZ